jgi:hypothetical protein
MVNKTVSVKNIFNIFPNNNKKNSDQFYKIELIVAISFNTFGQISYSDENNRPWIKEFVGNSWNIVMNSNKMLIPNLGVFLQNQLLLQNQSVMLTRKINNNIDCEQRFIIKGEDIFEGWFKI